MAANVTPGRWIGMGWNIFKEDIGNFILITFVFLAFLVIGNFVIAGPLLAGMFYVMRRRMIEGKVDVMDVFRGFNSFVDTLLIFVLSAIFGFIGLMLCIFPVLIMTAFYLFPYLFHVDRKLGFWDAMEASRKLVSEDLMGYILFVIALVLFNFFGLILMGVGLLVTIPVSFASLAVAYKEKVGFQQLPPEAYRPVNIP